MRWRRTRGRQGGGEGREGVGIGHEEGGVSHEGVGVDDVKKVHLLCLSKFHYQIKIFSQYLQSLSIKLSLQILWKNFDPVMRFK